MVKGSDFFRVILQLTHGCPDLGLEIGPVGDRHAPNSVGLEMFPDKLIWIAVWRIGWKIKQPQFALQALDKSFGQKVVYADLTAPCFPKGLELKDVTKV